MTARRLRSWHRYARRCGREDILVCSRKSGRKDSHMPFAVARWFICAFPFLLASAVNSQTPAPQPGGTPSGNRGSWKVLYEENFENPAGLFKTGAPSWTPDTYQNTDAFSDGGEHFQRLGVKPPAAFRAEGSFAKDGWLTIAAYSRSNLTSFSDLFQVVPDQIGRAHV